MNKKNLCITAALLATFSTVGCMVDTDSAPPFEEASLGDEHGQVSEALEIGAAGCAGYECTVTGQAIAGAEVRVSCAGAFTVMAFCYSLAGNCGPNPPNVGDSVCLADPPDGTIRRDTECLNDPCCIPCKKKDSDATWSGKGY